MTLRTSLTHPSRLLLVFALATSSTWAGFSDKHPKGTPVSMTNPASALAQLNNLVDQGVKTPEASLVKPAQSALPVKAAFEGGDETSDTLPIALAGLAMAVAIVQRRSHRG